MPKIPKIPSDMLRDLRLVAMSEYIGGAAPKDYAQYRRFKQLQGRRLIKYFDRARVRWDQTFFVATGYGHAAVANLSG